MIAASAHKRIKRVTEAYNHFICLGNHDALLALVKSGAEVSQQDKDGLSGKRF